MPEDKEAHFPSAGWGIRGLAVLLLVCISLAQVLGPGRRQAERASSAVQMPTQDMAIALVMDQVSGPHASAPAGMETTVKGISLSLEQSAGGSGGAPAAARQVLWTWYFGQPSGHAKDVLRHASAKEGGGSVPRAAVHALLGDLDKASVSDAQSILSANLGPLGLASAAEICARNGDDARAAGLRDRLHVTALRAQMKAGVYGGVLLMVILGATAAWTAYSLLMRRQRGSTAPAGEAPAVWPGEWPEPLGDGVPDAEPTPEAFETVPPAESSRVLIPSVQPPLWQTFVLYLVVVLALVPVVSGMHLPVSGLNSPDAQDTLASLAHYVLSALVALPLAWLLLGSRGFSLRDLGWRASSVVVDVGWGIGGFFAATGLSIVLALAGAILRSGAGIDTPDATSPVAWLLTGHQPAWIAPVLFVVVGVVAPLVEETFFRGALLGALRRDLGETAGVWLSSIAFALIHPGALDMLIPYVGLAWVFARMAVVRKSLLPCMIAHGLNNLFYVGVTLLISA